MTNYKGMRILLVEDHEATRRGLEQLFALNGVEVDSAASVKDALDKVDGQACAVLDWSLPDGTANDLMPALKTRGMPAAVFTVTAEPHEIERRTGLEASAVFLKPDFEGVMRWVARHVGKASMGSVLPAALWVANAAIAVISGDAAPLMIGD
jgi:CheY-like chemotaxis protein